MLRAEPYAAVRVALFVIPTERIQHRCGEARARATARQGKTNQWLHVLLPVLRATFRALGVAPARSLQALALRLDIELTSTEEALMGSETPPPFLP